VCANLPALLTTMSNMKAEESSKKNFFGYSTEVRHATPSVEGNARILQQTPAWALHLLLRASNAQHSVENVAFGMASGQNLPIFVQGNVVCSENSALLACSKSFSPDPLHENSSVPEDLVMATYVSSMRDLADWLAGKGGEKSSGKRLRSVRTLGSRVMEWYYALGEFDARPPPSVFAGCSEAWALNYLPSVYAYLESKINATTNRTLSGSVDPQLADAILFSHVMDVKSNPRIASILEGYSGIQEATSYFLQKYFTSPAAAQSWQVSIFSVNALLNSF
jgi:hypothetical protein